LLGKGPGQRRARSLREMGIRIERSELHLNDTKRPKSDVKKLL